MKLKTHLTYVNDLKHW